MDKDTAAQHAGSVPGRLIGRPRSIWITVGIGLVLFLIPLVVSYLSGILDELLQSGNLRQVLLPSVILTYILAVSPTMERMQHGVLSAFRPMVLIDDEGFDQLVAEASHINPLGEAVAFGAGAAFGVWLGVASFADEGIFWLGLCYTLLASLMVGTLIWIIYGSIAGTRLTTELLRQPLKVDIFDTEPFEPMGRHSLTVSLVILGGVVLGMIFGLAPETLYDWRNWILYGVLALVSVVIFFLSMRDTHRVLATEKQRELDAVQGHILSACRALVQCFEAGEDTGNLGAEINGLVEYEKRVQVTRTWPYNTTMLRTLFVSVIIPAGAAAVQGIFEVVSKGGF
jgi:hypothetical protein